MVQDKTVLGYFLLKQSLIGNTFGSGQVFLGSIGWFFCSLCWTHFNEHFYGHFNGHFSWRYEERAPRVEENAPQREEHLTGLQGKP